MSVGTCVLIAVVVSVLSNCALFLVLERRKGASWSGTPISDNQLLLPPANCCPHICVPDHAGPGGLGMQSELFGGGGGPRAL